MNSDDDDRVIAQRTLGDPTGGGSVDLVVYEPKQDLSDEHGDWVCRFEVRRSPDRIKVGEGHGIDSLQALLTALRSLRRVLKQEPGTLQWLDRPGELGIPMMIVDEDTDFLVLLEHLIEAEYCRQALMAKRRGTR